MRKVISISPNNRNIVGNLGIIALLSTITLLGSFTTLEKRDFKVKRVVIDAGHGGKDPGTSGKYSLEKDIALKIALKTGRYIEDRIKGVEVIYTRSDDRFIELNHRAEIANKNGADVFISIHCNAISLPNVRGTETYVMGLHKSQENLNVARRENEVVLMEDDYREVYEGFDPKSPESHIIFSLYQSAHLESSLKLAAKVEKQFKTRVGLKSRGVKQAGFIVLWRTSMPSILVETGFLTNSADERNLNDELKQDYIASGIFRAFRDYKEEMDSM